VILVDTSAWVEYFRGTGSKAHRRVTKLVESGVRLATTEVVVMEVLAGARDDSHEQRLRGLLLGCEILTIEGLSDYERAAALYRQCRRSGKTVRSLTDCLIAVVAIREDAEVLHVDRDFDTISRQTPMRIASLTGRG